MNNAPQGGWYLGVHRWSGLIGVSFHGVMNEGGYRASLSGTLFLFRVTCGNFRRLQRTSKAALKDPGGRLLRPYDDNFSPYIDREVTDLSQKQTSAQTHGGLGCSSLPSSLDRGRVVTPDPPLVSILQRQKIPALALISPWSLPLRSFSRRGRY